MARTFRLLALLLAVLPAPLAADRKVHFQDDFTRDALGPSWKWVEEDAARWQISKAGLVVVASLPRMKDLNPETLFNLLELQRELPAEYEATAEWELAWTGGGMFGQRLAVRVESGSAAGQYVEASATHYDRTMGSGPWLVAGALEARLGAPSPGARVEDGAGVVKSGGRSEAVRIRLVRRGTTFTAWLRRGQRLEQRIGSLTALGPAKPVLRLLAFNPNLASATPDTRVRLVRFALAEPPPEAAPAEIAAPKVVRTPLPARNLPGVTVVAATPSPDLRRLAVGSNEGKLQIWDAGGGDPARAMAVPGHPGQAWTRRVNTLAWSRDGRFVATSGVDGTVRVWETDTGGLRFAQAAHPRAVLQVAWSPDGARIATAGADGKVLVLDGAKGTEVASLPGHAKGSQAVAFAPGGQLLASGGGDNRVRIWDVASGQGRHTLIGHAREVTAVAWSPDGKRLVSGDMGGAVLLWDAVAGVKLHAWPGARSGSDPAAHQGPVAALAWSPDGKWIASGSADRTVRVREPETGRVRLVLGTHPGYVTALAWSADSQRLGVGTADNTLLHVWPVATHLR